MSKMNKSLKTLQEFMSDFDMQYKSGAFGKPVDDECETSLKALSFDMALFIRLMEFARESAKTDLDLHYIAENAEKLMANSTCLTMADYETLLGKTDQDEAY